MFVSNKPKTAKPFESKITYLKKLAKEKVSSLIVLIVCKKETNPE